MAAFASLADSSAAFQSSINSASPNISDPLAVDDERERVLSRSCASLRHGTVSGPNKILTSEAHGLGNVAKRTRRFQFILSALGALCTSQHHSILRQ